MVSGLATSHGTPREPNCACLASVLFTSFTALDAVASFLELNMDGFHLPGVFVHLLLAAFYVIHGLDNRSSSFKHSLIFFDFLHSSPNGCEGDD